MMKKAVLSVLVAFIVLWLGSDARAEFPRVQGGVTRGVEKPASDADANQFVWVEAKGLAENCEQAKQAALRSAVEKAAGAYVSSRSVVEDFELKMDEIYTKAAGFAYLDEVLYCNVKDGIATVAIRARVSRKPLLDLIKQNGLLAGWKVMVVVPETISGRPRVPQPAAEITLTKGFLEAGYTVIEPAVGAKEGYSDTAVRASLGDIGAALKLLNESKADILVTGEAVAEQAEAMQGAMVSARGRIGIKAIEKQSGRVIAIDSETQGGMDLSGDIAAKTALQRAAERLLPRLVASLSETPASLDRNVELRVSGLKDLAAGRALTEQIKRVPFVRRVAMAAYENCDVILDIVCESGMADRLPDRLEQMEKHALKIKSASKTAIRASVK